jgi:hypothetical protein
MLKNPQARYIFKSIAQIALCTTWLLLFNEDSTKKTFVDDENVEKTYNDAC